MGVSLRPLVITVIVRPASSTAARIQLKWFCGLLFQTVFFQICVQLLLLPYYTSIIRTYCSASWSRFRTASKKTAAYPVSYPTAPPHQFDTQSSTAVQAGRFSSCYVPAFTFPLYPCASPSSHTTKQPALREQHGKQKYLEIQSSISTAVSY